MSVLLAAIFAHAVDPAQIPATAIAECIRANGLDANLHSDELDALEDEWTLRSTGPVRRLHFESLSLDIGRFSACLTLHSRWNYFCEHPEVFAKRMQLCSQLAELLLGSEKLLVFPDSQCGYDEALELAESADFCEISAWFRKHHGAPSEAIEQVLDIVSEGEARCIVGSRYLEVELVRGGAKGGG